MYTTYLYKGNTMNTTLIALLTGGAAAESKPAKKGAKKAPAKKAPAKKAPAKKAAAPAKKRR